MHFICNSRDKDQSALIGYIISIFFSFYDIQAHINNFSCIFIYKLYIFFQSALKSTISTQSENIQIKLVPNLTHVERIFS